MKIIADLHFHSKYSRAVSPKMILSEIARWAEIKGIDLVTTADFTHPLWFRELQAGLVEVGEGIYRLNPKFQTLNPKQYPNSNVPNSKQSEVRFLLTTEIASIFTQGGKLRRIHTLIFAPNLAAAAALNEKLRIHGVNLFADGRPMTGLSLSELAEIIFSVSPDCLVIPAHLWTPWFGTMGDLGGFESLEEAYGDLAKYIFAIETGHSSDPEMNWRVEELDSRAILSFSDAHSPANMGREATVFTEGENGISNFKFQISNLSYRDIQKAIKGEPGRLKILHTVEFYPEEGRYHYTGHQRCGVRQSPEETKKLGEICPVCGKKLTIGVMQRVEQLGREIRGVREMGDKFGVRWVGYQDRPLFARLVPLAEIIGEALGTGKLTKAVMEKYLRLVTPLRPAPSGAGATEGQGGELRVLLGMPIEEIARLVGPKIAGGVKKVREGDLVIQPGYDGTYGVVKIWGNQGDQEKQMSLF
jgi:uncharacterized protein (TIGR00375 family)